MPSKNNKMNDSGAAVVCKHVAREGYPILLASRDAPVFPEDSGWQFLCDSGQDELEEDAKAWSLDEVLRHDPTLGTIVDSPEGTTVTRTSRRAAWRVWPAR